MTKTLTRKVLIENVLRSSTLAKEEAEIIVACFFKIINDRLISGETVKIAGLGRFILHDKRARPGRNPKTGKDAIISARRVVTFQASPKLKTKVAAYSVPVHMHEEK